MKIILVGNPNVGKSVIFNALTGRYATVSNYPGTTVEIARGWIKLKNKKFEIIDTPGINSLVVHSEDEKVTKNILSSPDIFCIIQVADSKNLKRSLLLTLELAELNIPIVLALNMMDEARERGIKIDTKKLSDKLGIDVVETVAITKQGIPQLKDAVLKAKVLSVKLPMQEGSDFLTIFQKRKQLIDEITNEVLKIEEVTYKDISYKLGKLTTHPIAGILILFLVLLFMYLFVGVFGAGKLVDVLEDVLFAKYINPFVVSSIQKIIPIKFISDFLIGEYGLFTMAFTYAFAIILPIVFTFFVFFGILEDSGYLPRLAVLSDRIFKFVGLSGKAILPIVLGLGCGTMATLTTRILETKKEKILATLLLSLCIPCSAQLGVILGMLSRISIVAVFMWLFIIILIMIIVGFFASKFIVGEPACFIQELPPLRIPQIENIVVKTFSRLKWYLKEAVPLFVLGTAGLFFLDRIGFLKKLEALLNPFVVGFLGLPKKITEVFILGFLRRDYATAGLYMLKEEGLLDNIGVFVSVVVITLFVPCIAQFFVMIKERGIKIASLIAIFVFIFSIFVGGILNFLLRRFGVNF